MADFQTAVVITMDSEHEGGFQNAPNDRGNWTGGKIGAGVNKGTKYGISAARYPDLDIINLTTEQAAEIYFRDYWNSFYTQLADQSIANKLFDLGVLFSPREAVLIMQGALAAVWPVIVDGKMGLVTLNQINNSEPVSLLLAYKTAFVTHAVTVGANNPAERGDVGGWIRRINS